MNWLREKLEVIFYTKTWMYIRGYMLMNLKMVLKAAFKIKNLSLLSFIIIIFAATRYIPFALIGAAGYIYFVLQTLKNGKFQKENQFEEKYDSIKKLNEDCNKLYSDTFNKIPAVMQNKIDGILKEKNELIMFFKRNSSDQLKQKIVEHALKLVVVYLKLIYNHSIRIKELNSINIEQLMERISNNSRKNSFLKNIKAQENLQRAIEVDKKLLERVKSERNKLEIISSKLDYIESAILMFKHQIISSDSADPLASDIDNLVNEALALDNVLQNKDEKLRL